MFLEINHLILFKKRIFNLISAAKQDELATESNSIIRAADTAITQPPYCRDYSRLSARKPS